MQPPNENAPVLLAREDAIAVLTLHRPPANAISRDLLDLFLKALSRLEADPPHALVLTAAGERFFCGGLDLLDLAGFCRGDLEKFVFDFTSALSRLYRLPCPVVAAINGHAVAGGALLALCADKRLMADSDSLFGLNEIRVGLPLPAPLFEIVRSAIDPRRSTEVLLEGRNFEPREAVDVGFVHEVVAPEALRERAVEVARELASLPRAAYARSKALLRPPDPRSSRVDERFVAIWFDSETQALMEAVRERLRSGRSRPQGKGS